MKVNSVNDVNNLWNAATSAAALGAAIETGLLWLLADKPMPAAEIVHSLGIPGKRGYYWLQLLEKIGILEGNLQGYTTSSIVRQAILDRESYRSPRQKQENYQRFEEDMKDILTPEQQTKYLEIRQQAARPGSKEKAPRKEVPVSQWDDVYQ